MILIGYSGHAFVIYGIIKLQGGEVIGYCDKEKKVYNPFKLEYLGKENTTKSQVLFKKNDFFISIGDNNIRQKIFKKLSTHNLFPVNVIHPSAHIDHSASVSKTGIMVGANVSINPLAIIGRSVICNTGSIIEHECVVCDFAHIGPGATLCGNVKVGERSLIGANAVIRQGITIGNNAIIGAGAVVIRDVPDNSKVVGIPAR